MSRREKIVSEINKLFGDTSQSPRGTLDDLEHIEEHVASLIETMKDTFSGPDFV